MDNGQRVDMMQAVFQNGCWAGLRRKKDRAGCLLALCLLAASTHSIAAESGDFTYEVLWNSACTITGYTGAGGNIDIPYSITDGPYTYLVTEIGYQAFQSCTHLDSVTIPSGVTRIEPEAFRGCSRLTRVIIPARVTEISGGVFQACSNLTSVTISAPRRVIINSGAFSDCTSLSSVYVLGDYPSFYDEIFYGVTNVTVFYQPQKSGWSSTFAGRPAVQLPFKYVVTVEGKASFCGFGSPADGEVTVPAEAGGYPVTEIGGQAFWGCTGLTRVTLPTTIARIGTAAFFGCEGLTSITIPDSVTNIESYAFADCVGLRNVTFGPSVISIGTGAFSGCLRLMEIPIPASVAGIGDQAFDSCSGASAITGLSGVTCIGSGAFSGCSGLSGITIPDGVTHIGWWAFSDSTGLTNVAIPGSVTHIGDYAFSGCSNMRAIRVAEDNANYSSLDGVLFNRDKSVLIRCPSGMTGNYTVSQDVAVIESEAFSGCASISGVTIPASVTRIGGYAFEDCTRLTTIDVDPACANYCSSDGVLFDNPVTTLIQYPAAKTQASYAVPSGVVRISPCAFKQCAILNEVEIPASVTTIGNHAFLNCAALKAISVDPANASYSSVDGVLLGNVGWQNTVIQCPGGKTGSYTIPNNIQAIGECAFFNCTGLNSVSIPEGLNDIGDFAFFNCTGLTNMAIPSVVYNIGETAFLNCSGLTAIDVDPNNWCYSSVDGVLFNKSQATASATLIQCPGGKAGSCVIPYGVTSIGKSAFFNCAKLTSIDVDEYNEVYSSASGVLFNKSQTTLIQCPGGKAGSYCLPSSVTRVGDYAFFNCGSLQEITVDEDNPNYCSLDGVLFNKGMDGLLQYPGGKSESSYTVSDAITCIGGGAFSGAASLTGVYFKGDIPSSVGLGVFSGTDDVTVYYMPGAAGWGDPFFACRPAVLLPYLYTATDDGISLSTYVGTSAVEVIPPFIEGKPVTRIESYAFFNCASLTSVTIPSGVLSIGDSAFENCVSLTSVTVPASVLHIGDAAFFNCESLAGVTLPDSVTRIGNWAFAACDTLPILSIPAGVTRIGNYAFGYCSNLSGIYFKGDAPEFGWAAFTGSGVAAIYYLPGAVGWDQPIAGQTPVLWSPQVQPGSGFGCNDAGQFGFTVLGTHNMVVAVEACTNLAHAVWLPLSTVTLANGIADVTDASSANHPTRYYRFRMP